MFRNTTAEDVAFVVANLRPEDAKEWWLASGKPAVEAIAELGEKPYVSFTLTKGDEPVAIFGASRWRSPFCFTNRSPNSAMASLRRMVATWLFPLSV